jgi:hypothetical protein
VTDFTGGEKIAAMAMACKAIGEAETAVLRPAVLRFRDGNPSAAHIERAARRHGGRDLDAVGGAGVHLHWGARRNGVPRRGLVEALAAADGRLDAP